MEVLTIQNLTEKTQHMFINSPFRLSILILFAIVAFSSCKAQGFNSLSKQIQIKNEVRNNTWKGETFHDVRVKLYNAHKLDFVQSSDTTFFVEHYDVEAARYIGSIWSSKGDINYIYSRKVFSYEEKPYFSDYVHKLINNWDTATIKMKEKQSLQIHENWFYVTRVTKKETKYQIDNFSFKEFSQ
jgi:hypothetical protein